MAGLLDRITNKLPLVLILSAFFAPTLLALLLSATFLSDQVVPELVLAPKGDPYASQALASLSERIMTLGGATFLSSVYLFNRPVTAKAARLSFAFLILESLAAFTTTYAGMRFLYDMALQISVVPFSFPRLKNRLLLQGLGLLLQISLICAHAVFYHFYRDRLFKG